jgi:hypothetical protein
MDDNAKERLTKIMQNVKPGMAGLLAMDIEGVIVRVPAPRIVALMALEIVIDASARAAKRNPQPEIGDTFEQGREVSAAVREYIQGLSDEEFDNFTSEETMNEMTQLAMNRIREMMEQGGHSCEGCGACGAGEDGDVEDDPDPLMN